MSSLAPKRTASNDSSSSSQLSSENQDSSKRPRTNGSTPSPTSSTPTIKELPDKHTTYTTWALDQGISISNVGPRVLPGRGVGLLATAPIKAHSQLIFVTEKSMIKSDSSFLKKHALHKVSPQAQLAAYLTVASQSDPRPEWYESSRAVWPTPDDFKECMLAWSEPEELVVLRRNAPPSILSPLERLLLDLKKDVDAVAHLHVEGQGEGNWSDDYLYHWILVNTRSFHWKPEGVKEGSMVMCPFLDYMNHCPNGHGCTVTVSTKGYELTADRKYDTGEEILATYGAHPNDKLLVHYGFVLPDSPDDEIRLDHVILPRLSESQQSILQDVGYLGGYALDPSTNELCFKTQVAVRSILLTANEWEHYMGSGEDLASDKDPDVVEWLRPGLEEYAQEAENAIDNIASLREEDRETHGSPTPFDSKLALLQIRWTQIQEALERFLDPPTMA